MHSILLVKDAYRRVALVHHPDMNHQGQEEKEKSRKIFEKATLAKDELLGALNAK